MIQSFVEEIQLYFETLCEQHKQVQHKVDGLRAFSRFETEAHIHEIVQHASPNIVVISDINGGRTGSFDDQKVKHYLTIIFATKAWGEDQESAVHYAVRKSEEIMMDFMARLDVDFHACIEVLQNAEPERAEWGKIDAPWLDNYYGWEFSLPFSSFMRPYDASKWLSNDPD